MCLCKAVWEFNSSALLGAICLTNNLKMHLQNLIFIGQSKRVLHVHVYIGTLCLRSSELVYEIVCNEIVGKMF